MIRTTKQHELINKLGLTPDATDCEIRGEIFKQFPARRIKHLLYFNIMNWTYRNGK
jgi:hypothetical protein